MNKAEIFNLAKKLASCEQTERALGMTGMPQDWEARLSGDARYRIARDATQAAREAYRSAIKGLSSDDLSALANFDPDSCQHEWSGARSPLGGIDGTCAKCGEKINAPG